MHVEVFAYNALGFLARLERFPGFSVEDICTHGAVLWPRLRDKIALLVSQKRGVVRQRSQAEGGGNLS